MGVSQMETRRLGGKCTGVEVTDALVVWPGFVFHSSKQRREGWKWKLEMLSLWSRWNIAVFSMASWNSGASGSRVWSGACVSGPASEEVKYPSVYYCWMPVCVCASCFSYHDFAFYLE